jgi:predicted hotdog family 3-hydroxylacyl-ACP dehydratase
MTCFPYSIDRILPHAAPMILLDEVTESTPEMLIALVTIELGKPFFTPDGMPTHVAIEFMAQACGAFAGVEALQAGRTPGVGLLLGTRNFTARQKWFQEGEQLRIIVDVVYREDEMGVFDCRVINDSSDETLASARLTVYQPSDEASIEAFSG